MTMQGKKHTEETRKKISESKRGIKGRPALVPQLCACGCGEFAAIDERRQRVSKFVSGHNGARRGQSVSEETRAKLAQYSGERASSYKHGWSTTPTWKSWKSMHERCEDPRNASYKRYGARGIKVCERWSDFTLFLADMGERPSKEYSIDRIDPEKGYEPGNCRWLTVKEQNARRRDPGGWIARRAAQQHAANH
jgi:hypothetical protein